MWLYPRTESKSETELDLAPIPNDSNHVLLDAMPRVPMRQEILFLAIGAVPGGTLFGGLHCLAWNFHFPTPAEALAWKICSVITSGLPLLFSVPLSTLMWSRLLRRDSKASSEMTSTVSLTFVIVFLVLYVLARLLLIVEMFRALFFLPPEAFIDTWSGSFPHWG